MIKRMVQTINISLPKTLSKQIRTQVKEGGYVSISEFIREAVRNSLKTSAAFSPEAEKEILKIAKSPTKSDLKFDTDKTSVGQMFEKIEKNE